MNVLAIDYLLKRIRERLITEKELVGDEDFKSFITDVKKYPVLSQEEMYDLIRKSQNGDKEARDKIIKHNLGLVISVAKKYVGRGIPIEDLVQEGTFGLLTVIDKFDISKGNHFSTYAIWWIKLYIYQYIYKNSRNIRLPVNQHESILKYKKAYSSLLSELHRTPTIDEIAEKLQIDSKKVLNLYNLQADTVSLNKKILTDEDGETELGYFIKSEENVEKEVISNALENDIYEAIESSRLNDKERITIIYRFGLFNNPRMKLEEIGKKLNITRERVRQIEAKALQKLRNSSKCSRLFVYLNDDENNKKELITDNSNDSFIERTLPKEAYNYFNECKLTSIEMYILSLYMGIIGDKPKTVKEIAPIVNKSLFFVDKTKNSGFNKLKSIPSKSLFVDYLEKNTFILKNDIVKEKEEPSLNVIFGCTIDQLERASIKLSKKDYEVFKKRNSDNYKVIMTHDDIIRYNTSVVIKLRKKVKEIIEYDNEHKEWNRIKKEIDNEVSDKLERIYDTKMVKDLKKVLNNKQILVYLLMYGYLDGSYYPADYVSKLLNMSVDEVIKALEKADKILKDNKTAMKLKETNKVKKLIK